MSAESLIEWNAMRMRKAAQSLNLLPDDIAHAALATRIIDAWTNIDRDWPWPVPLAHYEIALSALTDTAPVVAKTDCPRNMTKEQMIEGLKAGRTLNVDRKDAPELSELLEMERQGLVTSRLVVIDEQSSVLKFKWK